MELLRENFLRTYANVPIGLRDDVILVLEDSGPISWNVAYLEIKNNTELSGKILEAMRSLKLI